MNEEEKQALIKSIRGWIATAKQNAAQAQNDKLFFSEGYWDGQRAAFELVLAMLGPQP